MNVNASPEGVAGAGALAELVGRGGAASRPQGGHPVLPPGTGDHGLHRSSVYEGAEPAARELDRTLLLVSLLRALDHWYDVLVRGHIEEVEDRWRARSTILGRQVTLEQEGERYRGRVVDLSVTEGIILELAPGLTRLFPPEHVTLVPEP